MKILFTGASSFSGMWFVRELVQAGHEVTAIFRRPLEEYSGVRRQRIDQLLGICIPLFNVSFGESSFLEAISSQNSWDLFCHHAADVTNYRSPDFDAAAALASNTKNIKAVLMKLQDKGCNRVLLTGSVFEQNEGAGSDKLRAVSAYGLSKGLTADAFDFYAALQGMSLGKFVIPNPFGPYEEGRFTTYLIQTWLAGKTPSVNTPSYIRDNIPVTLLSKAYVQFAEKLTNSAGMKKYNPSYYVETQGAFTQRFAVEMKGRLGLACDYELKHQAEFPEPLIRINTDKLDGKMLGWEENPAWDNLATYYQKTYA